MTILKAGESVGGIKETGRSFTESNPQKKNPPNNMNVVILLLRKKDKIEFTYYFLPFRNRLKYHL
ncbi:hypothetical protein LEP1GSC178_0055 [Leptospira licerasiae str. MMD4847]|uniref:Uncharacterized protein n=1 Tax=Leptospira licerasiae str. MMD4847 TaxID=1049971 RepID=A0ABP2RIS0_9LEPT|nr:hypothetical protein LEP1GSC178_0055 [Leptospira licerasiae str. MMD4847]